MDCIKHVYRKARKQHECFECGDPIEVGEKYEYVSGIWDGKPDSFKVCLACEAIRNQFFCDGYYFGHIWEDIHAHIQEMEGKISSECILKLPQKGMEKLIDAIDEYFENGTMRRAE